MTQENKVEYRPVKLGALQNGLRVVTDGLSAGERVVVNGTQHARPGMAVTPKMVALGTEKTQTAAR